MIFHIVETLAASPIWIGFCGFSLVVLPIMGIAYIHKENRNN